MSSFALYIRIFLAAYLCFLLPKSSLWTTSKFMLGPTAIKYGVSEEGRDLLYYHVKPKKHSDTAFIFQSGEHGSEKGSVLLNMNLLLCRDSVYFNSHMYHIPIVNPDGFAKYGRRNSKGIDLNRDAYSQKAKESQYLAKLLEKIIFNNKHKYIYFFSLHMTGNIFLLPTKKTKSYRRSVDFRRKYLPSGWYTRSIQVKGTWIDYVSDLGVGASVLIEVGRRVDGVAYTKDQQRKFLKKPLKMIKIMIVNAGTSR